MSQPLATLRAVSDPVRLDILDLMASGYAVTATRLAEHLPITRQAVARHVAILEEAGLVEGQRQGREQRYRVVATPIEEAEEWLHRRAASWDQALQRLSQHLDG